MFRWAPSWLIIIVREVSFLSCGLLELLQQFWFNLAGSCVDELMRRYDGRT